MELSHLKFESSSSLFQFFSKQQNRKFMSFTQSLKSTMNFRSKFGFSGIQVPVHNWDGLQQKYYSTFQKQYCFGRKNEPLPSKMLNKQFIQSLISQDAEHTGETKRAPIESASSVLFSWSPGRLPVSIIRPKWFILLQESSAVSQNKFQFPLLAMFSL